MNPDVEAAIAELKKAEAKAIADQAVADESAPAVPKMAMALKATLDKAYGLAK